MPIGSSHLTQMTKKSYPEAALSIFGTIEGDVKNKKNNSLTFSKDFTKPLCYVSSAIYFFLILEVYY